MEKRGKEIILLVLAVALVAVAAVTLLRRPAPAPPPAVEPATARPEKSQPGSDAEAAKPAKPELPTPQALLGGSAGSSPNRNPFSQPGGAAPSGAAAAAPTDAQLPPGGPGALPPNGPAGAATSALLPVAGGGGERPPVAQDTLYLSGVIRGRKSVAILRRGEARYFVGRGERVEGNYVVAYIGPDSVILKDKAGNKMSLQLGGGR